MELYGENNEERRIKEEKIKEKVLIDNTAQAIFNYLKEIENKREIFENRWIWELLQNALDAAPKDGKIKVEITNENNRLNSNIMVAHSNLKRLHISFITVLLKGGKILVNLGQVFLQRTFCQRKWPLVGLEKTEKSLLSR